MLLADLMTFKVKFELVSQHVMLLADLMTFKVRLESVNQHVMLLADLMTFKVKFEGANIYKKETVTYVVNLFISSGIVLSLMTGK